MPNEMCKNYLMHASGRILDPNWASNLRDRASSFASKANDRARNVIEGLQRVASTFDKRAYNKAYYEAHKQEWQPGGKYYNATRDNVVSTLRDIQRGAHNAGANLAENMPTYKRNFANVQRSAYNAGQRLADNMPTYRQQLKNVQTSAYKTGQRIYDNMPQYKQTAKGLLRGAQSAAYRNGQRMADINNFAANAVDKLRKRYGYI